MKNIFEYFENNIFELYEVWLKINEIDYEMSYLYFDTITGKKEKYTDISKFNINYDLYCLIKEGKAPDHIQKIYTEIKDMEISRIHEFFNYVRQKYIFNKIKELYPNEYILFGYNSRIFIDIANKSKNYKEYLSNIRKEHEQKILYDKLNIVKIYKPIISLSNNTEKSKNKVFDFITVEISMFGYTTNRDQLIQKIKKNKSIYDKLVLKTIKESKEFQKYQVPINILSLDNMRFMNTGHLVYKFGIKKTEDDNCKST